ncbi:MAG: hypothetical protein K2H87_05145, partial [Duncaniella sp.]|nr:hypothetical protein [Duncaniella sp.]
YKAVNDSAVFNKDAYLAFFRRFFGVSEARNVVMKEVIIEDVRPEVAVSRLEQLRALVAAYLAANPAHVGYVDYWMRGYDIAGLDTLRDDLEGLVDRLSNSRSKMVINTLMDFPILRNLWVYRPSHLRWLSWAMILFVPVGVPVWLLGRKSLSRLRYELETISKVAAKLIPLINENPNPSLNSQPSTLNSQLSTQNG